MSNLDEESFEQKSEVDENSGVSDELSDVDDEELLSEFNNENKLKKKSLEDIDYEDVSNFNKPSIAEELELDLDDDDEEEEEEEGYLKKFDKELRKNYLVDFHPEILSHNNIEIQTLSEVIRDPKSGIIIDDLHKTIPFMTKYEKTRILGIRAKQIDSGSKPFIRNSNPTLIDGYAIAQKELENKLIPFIIRRPLPNGGSEFWKIKDLQMIH
jgi:DNA-directed RNA polymerase I, II, and III subunit RPABC2